MTFIRNSKTRHQVAQNQLAGTDPEKQPPQDGSVSVSSETRMINGTPPQQDAQLIKNTSVFTWRNLRYTVKVPDGTRLLLDNVCGFIKPGSLGALMGASGAGKVGRDRLFHALTHDLPFQTTLLDVLAQRKTEGTIEGEVHVDGRPLPIAFQRSAGYCEQLGLSRMQHGVQATHSIAPNRCSRTFSYGTRSPRILRPFATASGNVSSRKTGVCRYHS